MDSKLDIEPHFLNSNKATKLTKIWMVFSFVAANDRIMVCDIKIALKWLYVYMTQCDYIHVCNSANLRKYLSPHPDTTHWQL